MVRHARHVSIGMLLSALMVVPAHATPGEEASIQGVTVAQVVAPLKLEAIEPLEFGTVVAGQMGAGTVTIAASDVGVTYTGSLRGICGASSANCHAHPARFAVTGEAGRHYRIELPVEAMAYSETGHAPALRVARLTARSDSLANGSATGLLDQEGKDSFRVGGTLEVPGGTNAGVYRARLDVLVIYN